MMELQHGAGHSFLFISPNPGMEKEDVGTPTERTPLRTQPVLFARQLTLRVERSHVQRVIKQHICWSQGTQTMFELIHQLDRSPGDPEGWVVVRDRRLFARGFDHVEFSGDPEEMMDNRFKAETTLAPKGFVLMWDMVRDELNALECVSYMDRQTQRLTVGEPRPVDALQWCAEKVYGRATKDVVVYRIVLNCVETARHKKLLRDSRTVVTTMALDPKFRLAIRRILDSLEYSEGLTPRSDTSATTMDDDTLVGGGGGGVPAYVQRERVSRFMVTPPPPVATAVPRRSTRGHSLPPAFRIAEGVEMKLDDLHSS